jgi:glutathione S-transferase
MVELIMADGNQKPLVQSGLLLTETAGLRLLEIAVAKAEELAGKQFLLGDSYTVADAYLFTVLNWSHWVQLDLAPWPAINEYLERVGGRPAVQAVLKDEGLLG